MLRHEPVTARDAEAARKRLVGSGVVRTPLLRLDADQRSNREIYIKLENLQPIGSFKLRGMWNGTVTHAAAERRRGVWTLSAGNAAQGLAWTARRLGIECSVVVPDNAPRAKLDAIERLGARTITVPIQRWFELAATRAFEGLDALLVHPFSDPAVMSGNGTIALEILEDLPEVDAVVVPWGGGGLTAGIAGVLRDAAPSVKVFASEWLPTAPLRASLDVGGVAEVPYRGSFIDGIGAPRTFGEMFDLAQRLQVDALAVPLDEVAAAIRLLAHGSHVIAEGAGAVSVAAALRGGAGDGRIACIVSGGNIDPATLTQILGRGKGP